jgi:hypothetical protein
MTEKTVKIVVPDTKPKKRLSIANCKSRQQSFLVQEKCASIKRVV